MDSSESEFEAFDHRAPNHRPEIEDTWARMRQMTGLPHCPRYGGFHVVTRYEDVMTVATKHKTFSSARGMASFF